MGLRQSRPASPSRPCFLEDWAAQESGPGTPSCVTLSFVSKLLCAFRCIAFPLPANNPKAPSFFYFWFLWDVKFQTTWRLVVIDNLIGLENILKIADTHPCVCLMGFQYKSSDLVRRSTPSWEVGKGRDGPIRVKQVSGTSCPGSYLFPPTIIISCPMRDKETPCGPLHPPWYSASHGLRNMKPRRHRQNPWKLWPKSQAFLLKLFKVFIHRDNKR